VTHNPVLLDHLPVAAIDLDGMADETTRRLFEALRLEIRYDPANLIARRQHHADRRHDRRCLPHQPGNYGSRVAGTCDASYIIEP
jgi:hypothetical protein